MTLPINTADNNSPFNFWLMPLMMFSTVVIAGSQGYLELPEYYRTPLSDVIYDEHTTWRATPEDDNGWRKGQGDLIHQGRLRREVLPHVDYDQRSDPTLDNIFMNENELAKPKTNVFRLNF